MIQNPQDNVQKTGNISIALQHAHEMLIHKAFEPALEQGQEILKLYPNEPNALFIVGSALREVGQLDKATNILQKLVKQTSGFAIAHQELAFALAEQKKIRPAISSLTNAINIESNLPLSWKLLSELFQSIGDSKQAEHAYNNYLRFSAKHPKFGDALQAFIENKLAVSENLCREHLKQHPTDVNAIRLLAEIAIKLGIFEDAEHLLIRCLELAPDYQLARLNYAHVLNKREKSQQALAEIDKLEQQKNVPPQQILKAAILVRLGKFKEAINLYDHLITTLPEQAGLYTSRGHALKTIGEQGAAIASYRQAITCLPCYGEAYWSLANLKIFRFEQVEIEQMQKILLDEKLSLVDRVNICFALGKALEDTGEFAHSFSFYQQGNTLKEKIERYDANETSHLIARTISVCTPHLFSQEINTGCSKPDPIFIVGLPRSGSTLLEQILASHSMVDGTKELPDITAMVRRLSERKKRSDISKYPEVIARISSEQLKSLGEEYINKTLVHRGSAPYFIDKMPNNFAHIGLIKRILPNAKIIDARRHPMSACFSGYKQLFSSGQAFSYGLENIGRYYVDYIKLMNHWHQILPGQILTVHYEEVVNDFESQVRDILDFCGLPFEHNCLEYYKNSRAVNTASSEQVRQPIYQSGLNSWSNFEAHLMPLKTILKPVID